MSSIYDYVIDWEYLRQELIKAKGDDSYIDLLLDFPGLGKTTCYRFITREKNLNLKNLLVVINGLNLHIEDVIIEREQAQLKESNEKHQQMPIQGLTHS